MKATEFAKQNKTEFLQYFHSKFPIFHLSNVFYLDIKYALKYYLLSNHFKVSDEELESLSVTLINGMASDGVFKRVSKNAWILNYPEFRTKTPGKPILL